MPENPRYQEFLSESEDIIHGLIKNLQHLQTLSISSNSISPDTIDALFRGMHSLKGMSSLSGFPRMAALSHRLEDLLDDLRFDRIKIDAEVVDTLFEGIDVLVRLLTSINEKGGEDVDIDSTVNKIGNITKEKATGERASLVTAGLLNTDLSNKLSDYETHRVGENIRQGTPLFRISAVFGVDAINEAIATLRDTLTRFGEVIAFIPVSGFSTGENITFDIIFASPEEKIEERLENLKVNAVNIQAIKGLNTPAGRTGKVDTKSVKSSAKGFTSAVRVGVEKIDTLLNNVGEIFLLGDTICREIKDLKEANGYNSSLIEVNSVCREIFKKLSLLRDDLIEIRMVPIGYMFDRLSRIVSKISKELAKEVRVEVYGEDTKLDKSMMEGLADPLMHIVRNAVDHGIEDGGIRVVAGKSKTGTITLRAAQRDGRILIEIEDDGGGIDFERVRAVAFERGFINKEEEIDERRLIELLFQPGFSTNSTVSAVSGRGVGLDVVAKNIAGLGGMIDVDTRSGKGTKFSITLPLTLLMTRALIARDSGRGFAIPFSAITENSILRDSDMKRMGGREAINLRGHFIPLVRLRDILRFPESTQPTLLQREDWRDRGDFKSEEGGNPSGRSKKQYVIVVGIAERRAGIVVDEIKGQREILIKPMCELIGSVPGIIGFTEIGSGQILPVLDIGGIIDRYK